MSAHAFEKHKEDNKTSTDVDKMRKISKSVIKVEKLETDSKQAKFSEQQKY